jgi:choline dehydrogenase
VGSVTLASNDPLKQVNVDFKGYDPQDVNKMAAVIDGFHQLVATHLGDFVEEAIHPGPEVEVKGLPKWVQDNAFGHHACCTSKMGADNDEMAVLDSRMKVGKKPASCGYIVLSSHAGFLSCGSNHDDG